MLKRFIGTAAALVCAAALTLSVTADSRFTAVNDTIVAADSAVLVQPAFGDMNDFGNDGGGDWGGGNDDGGDYGGGYVHYDDDDDYNNNSNKPSRPLTITDVIIAVAVVAAIIIFSAISRKAKGNLIKNNGGGNVVNGNGRQGMNVNLPDRTAEIEKIIKLSDPDFSADDFMSFTKTVFVDINNAWCKRDLSGVRPVFHENLYNQSVAQIQTKIDNGEVVHVDRIAVNTAYPTGYKMDSQFEYITVYLAAQMIEWHENERTGEIIRGDKTTRWSLRYKMKYMRSVGVQTKSATDTESGHNCPNCGAPLEISSTGKCLYCNSVVTTGQYSWVLSEFGGVRNDTVDDGIVIPQEIRDRLNEAGNNGNGEQ